MDDKTRRALLLAGLGVSLSASAAILYVLFRKEPDDEEICQKLFRKAKAGISTTSRQTVIRVKVPNEMVGSIIGRQGVAIKKLQDETKTRIKFEDREEGVIGEKIDRVLIITGSCENAQEAETVIHTMINNQPEVSTVEIFVPVRACGRIIGRNGDTIRHMCHASKAKIIVDRAGDERDPDNMKLVTIRGTRAEIDLAINLIDEKLAEEEAFRQKVSLSSAGRMRYQQRLALNFDSEKNENVLSPEEFQKESLHPQSPDGYSEVYISAVKNPSQFWVQLVGTKSVDLDKLVDDMTDYYSAVINQEEKAIGDNIKVDDVVAAPFEKDVSWYRAKVCKIIKDEYSPSDINVELYYVDFGESIILPIKDICSLNLEFKWLPFQAIECCLAEVKPEGGVWKAEATELFEKLTYAAHWKTIMAKPVANPENDKTITYVQLIDTNCEKDINIAKRLIKEKFAVRDKKSPAK